jgi:hypothetical protein
LIDRMSEVGADPDMQTAAGAPLVAGFAEVVDQVIGDFMTDLSVFEQAIARVDALADQGLSEPACEYLRNHSRSGQAL